MQLQRITAFIITLIAVLASQRAVGCTPADSTAYGIFTSIEISSPSLALKAAVPHDACLDTLKLSPDHNWWINRLKAHTLNLKDSTVEYPRFLKSCVDVYNWADIFFNGTDHDYVVGTSKRWKARIASDNWLDMYALTLPKGLNVAMSSNVSANIGGYIQYMAVSAGYSYDFSHLFGSDPLEHKKYEFGFNCARFDVNLYYQENTGGTNLRKFGKYFKGRILHEPFTGLAMKTAGIDAIYFLNNKRYSHGAAYNFSRIQKRSQGSFIVGASYTNLHLNLDFALLPPDYLTQLTIPANTYTIHYNSYAAVIGYGFNWVITPRLLYNITAIPSFGASHCYPDSESGEKWMMALNVGGRTSLTYNLGNWFFNASGKFNGHWYKRGTFSLLSSIVYFSGNIGFRF